MDAGGPLPRLALRLRRDPSTCVAPWYLAEELLRAEGLTDLRYMPAQANLMQTQMIGRGEIDFGNLFAGTHSASRQGRPSLR